MSELSKRSGVPAATIRYYIKEGLLPEPKVKTSRNMAYYDESFIEKIKKIKVLQKNQFLPLKMIKSMVNGEVADRDDQLALNSLAKIIDDRQVRKETLIEEIIKDGYPITDIEWLEKNKLIQIKENNSGKHLQGEDLVLVEILKEAREKGLNQEMLPISILSSYQKALNELVAMEIQMFRMGVLSKTDMDKIPDLMRAGSELSERLVLVLRRKLLLPMMETLVNLQNEKS